MSAQSDATGSGLFDLGALPFSLNAAILPRARIADRWSVDSRGSEGWHSEDFGRAEFLIGAIAPQDSNGMALGRATANTDFDLGVMIGVRGQTRLASFLLFGAEIDIATHDVGAGDDVFFPGEMTRVYFMLPLTFEFRLGTSDSAPSLGFTVAPGFQVAVPNVDGGIDDFNAFNGRFIQQDPFVGLALRATAGIRIPVAENWQLIGEVQYDWSFGHAEVQVLNGAGAVLSQTSDDINLGSLNIFAGMSFAF